MLNIRSLLSAILTIVLLSSIQSFADTFVVTNLNDSGEGSLRRAITISNAVEGPDEIVFEEGLTGTILHNLGTIFIQDDLTIVGPGADKITIDAFGNSDVFAVRDFDDEINRVVKISGLRFINGNALEDGAIVNYEILTVDSCEFINGNASLGGGAIGNRNILTVDSCLFDSNFAPDGGAIMNYDEAINLSILNSTFIDNQADFGGAIHNRGRTELITSSAFTDNTANSGGGAIFNNEGTIKEISNSTFNKNFAVDSGGAIFNLFTKIEMIMNSTFTDNVATVGNAIRNDGIINISFTTIANNNDRPTPPPPTQARGGIVTVNEGLTNIRNSIIAFNSPVNCFGLPIDVGGNYSDNSDCDLTGDNSEIILGPLADNGGPTETMDLLGGDPIDGATVNCDALNEMGNPTGIPIGIDQRYFPRPFGVRCDSGSYEAEEPQPQPPRDRGGSSCGPDPNIRISGSIAPAGANNSIPLYLFIPALILIRRFVRRNSITGFKGQ